MSRLRAIVVTPLTGSLIRFGRESAKALTLWAEHAAELPPSCTGVDLDVLDANPDPGGAMQAAVEARPDALFGPYGSGTTLAAARATDRVIWNHGGAISALRRPDFPNVINVLSPASSYFAGVLRAIRAANPDAGTVSVLHGSTSFGRDVASGAMNAARELGFEVRTVSFGPGGAAVAAATLPEAEVLLVVGGFEDEVAAAGSLLPGAWRAAAFVGAGVEEVLASLGELREALLGPAQWIAAAAPEPDEGPDAGWFVERFCQTVGSEPSYPAVQAFAAGILCARCLRDGGADDAAQLAAARQLECTTLYGGFRLDPESGLQVGHDVLIVQWQDGTRRVVWPPERAERPLLLPDR
jgi:ABC-type branched-subunit amino acid transport system substrate-binding protein